MTSSRVADPAELCRQLRETPEMQSLLATQPAFPTPSLVFAPLAAGGGMALVLSTLVVRGLLRNELRPDLATDRVFAGLAILIFVSLLVAAYGVFRWRRFLHAAVTAVPAISLRKRSETWNRTTFRMTFWFDGRGESEEVIDVWTFGDVRPGDVGAAWFRDGRLVGFRRLET